MEAPHGKAGNTVSDTQVRELVADAFARTTTPAPNEVAPDKWDLDLERSEIRSALAGVAWQKVPISFFSEHRQALFFLTPQGWAYYLPAYMLAVIDRYEDANTALTELASSLMPSGDAEIEASRRACLRALNETQHHALLKFIEWAASHHPDDIDDDDREVIVRAITREGGSAGNFDR